MNHVFQESSIFLVNAFPSLVYAYQIAGHGAKKIATSRIISGASSARTLSVDWEYAVRAGYLALPGVSQAGNRSTNVVLGGSSSSFLSKRLCAGFISLLHGPSVTMRFFIHATLLSWLRTEHIVDGDVRRRQPTRTQAGQVVRPRHCHSNPTQTGYTDATARAPLRALSQNFLLPIPIPISDQCRNPK